MLAFCRPQNRATFKMKLKIWLCYLACQYFILVPTDAINCPPNCKCAWVLDSLEVNCARSGLIDYPVLDQVPVEHLDLSSNYFVEFPKHFADIETLISLDLSNNQIEYIDSDALDGFSALRTLLLANNTIASWASINPSEAFRSAVSLRRLSLSGNRLSTFTADNPKLMLQSASLIQLELERCDITTVGGDHLINGLPNLEQLKLSHNPITKLMALPSKSLRVIELSDCKLSQFNAYMVIGWPSLEALNLSWNAGLQFGNSNDNLIISHSLNELDLSYCILDEIDLSGLPNLSTLHMRNNMLRQISTATFANNTLVENIDLSHNSLRLISSDAFIGLKRLNKLDLSYNEIARLDRTLFRANDLLVSLNLSRNVIEIFTKIVSNSLRDINLSWCEIIAVEPLAFTGLTSIQRLDLSNNLLKDFPGGMRSETLHELNLSNCKLSAFRNNTFRDFPELASLHLNGNRFTTPFPAVLFRSNKFLDRIWIGDNPWICNCHDYAFIDFYDYLTAKPQKLKDKNNVRCASPSSLYGLTWESACRGVWPPNAEASTGSKTFSIILFTIFGICGLIFCFACFKKFMEKHKRRSNQREYRRNQEEMRQIQRQNQRMLQSEGTPNAPTVFETNLPSYEDAIRMPKPERPIKSMLDLTATARARKKLERSRTDPDQDVDEVDNDLLLDHRQRFRSEEMLSNRDKERTAQIVPYRRMGNIEHNNSGTRRFSIEDSRFVAAHLKSQNLQSAEQIANFQSYENSPYTKRKPKIAEIPPFKRATVIADSVEFLTDIECENAQSKPGSPFAQRKPKTPTKLTTQPPLVLKQPPDVDALYVNTTSLPPAVEDYFGNAAGKRSSSSDESNFHVIEEPEVASLPDNDQNASVSTSDEETSELMRGKRKKRKNSTSRRASGNFTAAAAAAAANESSSSDADPIVVVHKPMRETIF